MILKQTTELQLLTKESLTHGLMVLATQDSDLARILERLGLLLCGREKRGFQHL